MGDDVALHIKGDIAMTTVAVLGTGIMGAPMARNLLKQGHQVRVWNRTTSRAEPLRDAGGIVAGTPAEAVESADVIITILTDGEAVRETMTGAAAGLRPGQIWAQMSTVGPAALAPLAELAGEHGLVFVDAPVQGTKQPAESGQLIILAAGPADARPVLQPLFDAMGRRTEWLGEDGASGAGTRLKLAGVNYAIALTAVLGESLALAKGLGTDPKLFVDLITGGPLDSAYFQAKTKALLEGDLSPSFTLANAEKDLRLVSQAAAAHGVRLDLTPAAVERFRRAIDQGHGDQDMAAAYLASFDPHR
ncbi:dehydrogenase [Sphaerisporangium rufum]|uniref:Dehydrogenase n=1 Tax=Sphaerisporangium rufum TaxID=1381558 RepID=A0A919UZU9_9ACTN|nr:dehydrogenase [Sphaerisporangium rufum]